MSEVVINVTKVEEVVTINATPNVTQILVNTNSGGGIPEAPIDGNLYGRKNATWEQVTSGGGIPDAPNDANAYVRSALGWVVGYTKSAIDTLLGNKVDKVSGKGLSQEDYTTAEKSKLASITEIFTTALKTTYDDAVTWITTNGTNILNHIASTSNPHNVTKSQVGLSNVVNADTTTTANITDSTNKRFVTDANLVVIGNTSGTNSGDNATNTTSNSYADAKVVAELASFKTANFLDFTSSGQTQLDGKQDNAKLISANYTALNNDDLIVNASCTITDVASPSDGTNFTCTIVNGTVTIGGVAYTQVGSKITRIYNSGSWRTFIDTELIDYSNISTIVGFASYTTKTIHILLKNGIGTCFYDIAGVSNSVTKSFTIDRNISVTRVFKTDVTLVNNSGNLTSGGRIIGNVGSNILDFRINALGSSFTNVNNATIIGQFNFIY